MGLLSKIFGGREAIETRSADYLPAHVGVFGPTGYNDSGVTITESNALIASTVWACVSLVAQTVSTLPVHIIDADGAKQRTHAVSKLLATSPNPFMTAAVFREAIMQQAMLYGGAYAAIERDELGRPVAVYPMLSDRTKPIRRNGEVVYQTGVGGTTHYLTADQVVVLLGWTSDGITPLSPVQYAKQTIGLSVAAERYAAKAFGTAGNLGGILQMPPMSSDAMKSFVESWRANYSGLDGAFKIAALPDPMKFVPTTMKPAEGQLIEARQALVVELCRIWKVPPSMLGVLEKSSYASLEQQNTAFYQQTILPWLVKLEQEFNAKLLLESEKDTLEIRFNADALLRASTQDRYAAYQAGRQAGFLSINDIRRRESLPPIAGGDTYLNPLNMEQVGTKPAPTKPDATRELLLTTAKRFVTKETKAIERAAKKHAGRPDDLRAWADTFYAEHAKLVAESLAPVLAASGITDNPHTIAKRHCDGGAALTASAIAQGLTTDELIEDIQARSTELIDELLKGNTYAAAA